MPPHVAQLCFGYIQQFVSFFDGDSTSIVVGVFTSVCVMVEQENDEVLDRVDLIAVSGTDSVGFSFACITAFLLGFVQDGHRLPAGSDTGF